MNYSFSTVLMAILTSNLLLIMVHLLFANSSLMIAVGYKVLGGIVILTLIRLFVPFEFPFARNIFLPGKLSKISQRIQHIFFSFHSINISIWSVFTVIWMLGAIIKFIQYIKQYRNTEILISLLGTDVTDQKRYSNVLNQLYSPDYAKQFQLFEIKSLPSPMIFSFSRPRILLPAENTYTSEELTFILKHEVSHYQYRDLHLKFLVQMLTIIYWWNPVSLIISKHLNAVLEMHIDHSLTQKDFSLIERYLACLLKLKHEAENLTPHMLPDTIILSINDADKSLLEKRFKLLTQKANSANLCRSLLAILGLSICLCSYFITLEANVPATECDGKPVFTLTEENAYIISHEDGTYHIYWNNQHIETVDSLEYYDSSIPIYSTKEEVYEN